MLSDASSLSGMCSPCSQYNVFSHTTKEFVGAGVGGSVWFLSCLLCSKKCWDSATEYLMALATRQKQNLQNLSEMKNVDIQHLITEQNNRTRQ